MTAGCRGADWSVKVGMARHGMGSDNLHTTTSLKTGTSTYNEVLGAEEECSSTRDGFKVEAARAYHHIHMKGIVHAIHCHAQGGGPVGG